MALADLKLLKLLMPVNLEFKVCAIMPKNAYFALALISQIS